MIANVHIQTAAATAGSDLLSDDRNNVSGVPRVMKKVGLVGSAAINDFWVDVFIGRTFVGRFYNTKATGTQINQSEDMIDVGNLFIPPGTKVSAICGVNAGAGNVDLMVQ